MVTKAAKQIAKKIITVVISLTLAAPMSFAAPAAGAQSDTKSELTGTRKQLATIVFSGLAGAILGLSTLSFYGRPQDHLSNIAIGFALGVIGGAIFTTYKAATHPYDAYDVTAQEKEKYLPLFQDESFKRVAALEASEIHPSVGWAWTF